VSARSVTTGYTGVHGGLRKLNPNVPRRGIGRASKRLIGRSDSRREMRFLLTVAVLAGLTLVGTAQEKPKQFKTKSSANKMEAAPKSTAGLRTPGGATTSATSKELRSVEREHTKPVGTTHAPKKAPGTAALKPAKEHPNPPINFGGSGKGGSGTNTRHPDPYKGRLKQKGSGHH